MRIVAIGDIHLYRLWLRPWDLLSKRALGALNLWLNRRHRFLLVNAPRLVERVNEIAPDRIVCTGDLTTTALQTEYRDAGALCGELNAIAPLFVVPGNHDRYTFRASRTRRFETALGGMTANAWPHHLELNERTSLIGLDPTRPNVVTDRGCVGPRQLAELADLLKSLPADRRVIVVCHYPLATPRGRAVEPERHALIDRTQLIRCLTDAGRPTLYLHGHIHEPWCFRPPGAPNVTSVDLGATIMTDNEHPAGQGFWEINVAAVHDDTPWSLTRHVPGPEGWQAVAVQIPGESGEPANVMPAG